VYQVTIWRQETFLGFGLRNPVYNFSENLTKIVIAEFTSLQWRETQILLTLSTSWKIFFEEWEKDHPIDDFYERHLWKKSQQHRKWKEKIFMRINSINR